MIPINWLTKQKILLNIVLSLLVIFIYNDHYPNIILKYLGKLNSLICSVCLSIIIAINIQKSNDVFFKILNNKITNTIGLLSFSLYVFNQLFTVNELWGANSTRLVTDKFPLILNLILLLLFSYISYNYYEKRFLRIKERFK